MTGQTLPGLLARQFHHPKIIAEHPASAETLGNWDCPYVPRRPELPRKWEPWGWRGAWGNPKPPPRRTSDIAAHLPSAVA